MEFTSFGGDVVPVFVLPMPLTGGALRLNHDGTLSDRPPASDPDVMSDEQDTPSGGGAGAVERVHPPVLQALNLAVLVLVLWLNGLAGSGGLSGESIGLIANRYPSWFLPANYVFGIWSLIYLGLTAFTVFQLLPGERSNPAVTAIGWWWPMPRTIVSNAF